MRQSKAVGRAAGSVRRVALTSLGAGLVVGAAAPMASAATAADEAPLTSAAPIAASAPLASSAGAPESVPLTASAPLTSGAPVAASAPLTSSVGASASGPMASMSSAPGLAGDALALSTAALSRANANWSHLGRLKLYPLAGTGIDPLSNTVSTDLSGIPVSTAPVTEMMSDGLPITDLPVIGALLGTPRG